MTIETVNKLIDKAKTRKDGIYSYDIFDYVVKANCFIAYREKPTGRIFERVGHFVSERGKGTVKDLKIYFNKDK